MKKLILFLMTTICLGIATAAMASQTWEIRDSRTIKNPVEFKMIFSSNTGECTRTYRAEQNQHINFNKENLSHVCPGLNAIHITNIKTVVISGGLYNNYPEVTVKPGCSYETELSDVRPSSMQIITTAVSPIQPGCGA